jgi:hypothetical protein
VRDPSAGLPTGLRLGLAAGLSALALGLPWSGRTGSCDAGAACRAARAGLAGADSPARLFLASAFLALLAVTARPRTMATRRVARAGTGALGVVVVLAAAHRSVPVLLCALAALALAAPPVWRRSRKPAVFGAAASGR